MDYIAEPLVIVVAVNVSDSFITVLLRLGYSSSLLCFQNKIIGYNYQPEYFTEIADIFTALSNLTKYKAALKSEQVKVISQKELIVLK